MIRRRPQLFGIAALGFAGCLIPRSDLMAVAVEPDAFAQEEEDASTPDAWSRDGGMPVDAFAPDACTPSCADSKFDDCSGTPRDCVLGCATSGPPRCLALRFTNVDTEIVNTAVAEATETLVVDAAMDLPACPMRTTQVSGAAVCVYAYASVTINDTLTVRGSVPVVIIGRDAFTVGSMGSIRAGANGTTPGPGGAGGGVGAGDAGDGAGPGLGGSSGGYDDSGGGGGGFCGAGGQGGTGGGRSGGAGGSGARVSLEPLVGGSGGGAGDGVQGDGGAGGGALQLASLGDLILHGSVWVGGGGGQPGRGGDDWGSGGGGGSGGGLLIEAPVVNLAGASLVASGGGGGGSFAGGSSASAGSNGELATIVYGGNRGSGSDSANGGGGAVNGSGNAGGNNTNGWGNGGGGGGGVGVIVIRRHVGVPVRESAPSMSPCFSEREVSVR